jgi:uncharacterized protein (TIGR00661 family)
MASIVLIVQGEGKGHMSQSMALKELLEEAGHVILKVFIGSRPGQQLPGYFSEAFAGLTETFQSPFFIRTPNQKGIYVGRSLLANLFRSLTYIGEIKRIRRSIRELAPEVVINFYDLLGAFALRNAGPGISRIGIGHHFLLHLEEYRNAGGWGADRWLLKWHTSLVMKSCDRVLALSFREVASHSGVTVVPPLLRKAFRELPYQSGNRYLAYLMTGGYLYDLVQICREDPGFKVDVFTDLTTGMELPPGIRIHPVDETRFREMMAHCRGLITTAGFDTAAEAAYHGIPLLVIPARGHFEQRCNSLDVERSGIGTAVSQLVPGIQSRIKAADRSSFRAWADQAAAIVLKNLPE